VHLDPNKQLPERIAHALAFEAIALLICAPLFSWLMSTTLAAMGALTLAVSAIAALWNVVYNAGFDRLERRIGFRRSLKVRLLHTLGFEGGLVLAAVPLAAWWLGISLWQALVLDAGLLLFFLPYTLVFNWAYDVLRARWVRRARQQA
jgi:uncharacterized membrane protein